MSYSSSKDNERGYESTRGSRSRYADYDLGDDEEHDLKRYRYDRGREGDRTDDHSSRERESYKRSSDSYHLTRTTKATQQKYSGTEIYPRKDANDKTHRKAQAVRSNTRIDENDERYNADHVKREKFSWENRDNFDGARKQGIEASDWAYPQNDYKHSRSGDFKRRPSLDRDVINKWNTER
ncbi:hypothetical protein LTR84_011215 [Exophiala bonariae]|uniref:Btz domain-containing protein n=1 Tax=Exophiala bonariae TaxID=1690606 RepID=A0AAV9NL00_9EURO|nr:hypothetical protein LTR84_011215 [Exophiala bonariae]